ncbi:ComEC/Rec2 family competence protein [Agromyces bracchium]|uniref:MBL fold metallo-hydrolase n=1 Tax=Agromyces bracchium TaxID=88376 RepID=A0A6I3M830_9MICO|nr:ComEC/Rec2 family competence protein [Agromyces bracchium]MTH68277.1 MBL fold metallo-hydrolase [Agromyces bracchium]
MRGHDLRLLGPAGSAWATAWLATTVPDLEVPTWVVPTVSWSLAGLALATMLLVGRGAGGWRGERGGSDGANRAARSWTSATAAVLLAATAAGLVGTSAWSALERRHPEVVEAAASSREMVRASVRLDSAPRSGNASPWSGEPRLRAAATLITLSGGGSGSGAIEVSSVRLDLSLPGDADGSGFGSSLVVEGRLSEMPAASRAAYRLNASKVVEVGPAPKWLAWTHPLREGLAEASAGLGGDGGALVPGLAIGDTSRVADDLHAAMTTASLTHLTAVSGANCAIITAAAFWIAGLAGLPRVARVVAALAALGGFVALVTPEASVVRASAMAIVVLTACATARAAGGVPALGLAIIALLAIDPWYATDAGFALSACATAGLVLLSRPLARVLARWMPRRLAAVTAIPFAAQLACQPVLVLLEPVIPVYGVPANLLAAPAAPIATMAGLVGCLLLPVLPSVGLAALQVAWVPASWIALLARGAERMPLTGVPWPPDVGGALLAVVAIGAGLLLVLAPQAAAGMRALRAARRAAVVALCLSVAVPLGSAAGPPMVASASRPTAWDVWQCDVGQGDAVLVRSAEAVMLVDAGPDPEALDRCLANAGVDRIDLVVLTHWDADHVTGTAALSGRVGAVLHGPLDGVRSARALEPLVGGGATHDEVGAGATGTLGEARWRVVWPRPGAVPGNDASVVLDLVTPDYRAIFLGDLGREAQDAMRRSTDLPRVDLVKVAHHGSADQSAELYGELAASVGLIGVGAENGYGHPTASLLGQLDDARTVAVRSDVSGDSALRAVPGGFELWSERDSGVGGAP